jgi:hypothetical protein
MALLTYAQAQAVLGQKLGECAALANLPVELAQACRDCGVLPANPIAPTDDEIGAVPDVGMLFEVALYYGFKSIVLNIDADELKAIGVSGDPEDKRRKYQSRLDRQESYIEKRYGVGRGTISYGTISLDFTETFDDSGNINP